VTYSIVARDPGTGELGVAVQSYYFSVGAVVPWAEPRVGAVATQSFVDPGYGSLGLELMRAGKSADEALRALTSVDELEARRQVAMIDASGTTAVHTGSLCVAACGHRTGDGYTVQANMMRNDTVWDAMAHAYEAATGDLASRLLDALDAAEAEGGDVRGRQSAALLVVRGEPSGKPWTDRLFDLRVEDHPDPVPELRRLVGVKRAFEHSARGSDLAMAGDLDAALAEMRAAHEALPDNLNAAFFGGVLLAAMGREDEGRDLLGQALAAHDGWATMLRRLPAAGLISEEIVARIASSHDG
jgi:uncharacterized Ntn-hydrolase superfamily protein